jgi:hypothetical protein
MDLVSGAAKPGTVITAQGTASDHGNLHNEFKKNGTLRKSECLPTARKIILRQEWRP